MNLLLYVVVLLCGGFLRLTPAWSAAEGLPIIAIPRSIWYSIAIARTATSLAGVYTRAALMCISPFYKTYLLTLIASSSACCLSSTADSNAATPASVYDYEIINAYPHDRSAFTQGLVFSEGFLCESTGLYGRSELRKIKLETAQVLLRRRLQRKFFAEGITVHRSRIIQLTWKARKGFVYDCNTLEPLGDFPWSAQGWGITHDQKHLIISEGTSTLHLLDPNTFKPIGKLKVHDNGTPVPGLNELEFVNGRIYANIWPSDRIAVISAENGGILAYIDLNGILNDFEYGEPVGVLNGIAYDEKNDRLFVTGKLWPHIFQIKLIPPD